MVPRWVTAQRGAETRNSRSARDAAARARATDPTHPMPAVATYAPKSIANAQRLLSTVIASAVDAELIARRICAACPLQSRCTTSARGRKLVLGEHDQIRREHRRRARDPQFQADYRRHRPMVERTIAWLTRGARRVPYRGVDKNNAWLHHRVAAVNLRRLLNLGLSIHDGAWTMA